jgi:hypothetical protein
MNSTIAPDPTSTKPGKAKHSVTTSGWDEALRLLWHVLAIFVAAIVGIVVKALIGFGRWYNSVRLVMTPWVGLLKNNSTSPTRINRRGLASL